MRQVVGAETWYSQDSTHKWEVITIIEVFPKEQGIWAHIRLLHCEDKQSKRLALKANRTCIWKSQRSVGKTDYAFKELMQNFTHPETQHRGRNLQEAWVRPTCWSWRAPWRGRRQPWQAPANINSGSSHFWKLILPSGWQAQFWSALSRGLGPEAYLPISWSVQLLRTSSLSNQLLRDPALYTNEPSSFCMGQDLEAKKTLNIFFFF